MGRKLDMEIKDRIIDEEHTEDLGQFAAGWTTKIWDTWIKNKTCSELNITADILKAIIKSPGNL